MESADNSADQEKLRDLSLYFEKENPPIRINSIKDINREGDYLHFLCDNESTLDYIRACQAFYRLYCKAAWSAGAAVASGGLTLLPSAVWLALRGTDFLEAKKIYHCFRTIGINNTFHRGKLEIRGSRILSSNLCGKWDELQKLLM
jgi:hypothetical protein